MSDALRASLWMIGAIVSFTSMAVAARAVSLSLDTFEIMTYRSAIGIGLVLAAASAAGTLRQISTRRLGWHAARNVSHFTGQNLWFFSLTVLPLAQVVALEFSTPLWAMLLSWAILGERLKSNHLIAGLVGFAGVLIVTRPGASTLELGTVTAALAAIGFAGSAVFTRRLTRTESITCIMFWLTVMQFVLGLACAAADGDIALPSPDNLPWVVVIAVTGLVAHFCLTSALGIAPAAVVMPVDFMRLPVVIVVGALLYHEAVDPIVLVGAALIFGGNYWNILSERRTVAKT